jgi:hypothetical protein
MSRARPSDRYRMAEMKRCHDHATAGRAGSGGDGRASGTSQGEAGVSAREGRLPAADRVGRGPDQRAGGAKTIKTGFLKRN